MDLPDVRPARVQTNCFEAKRGLIAAGTANDPNNGRDGRVGVIVGIQTGAGMTELGLLGDNCTAVIIWTVDACPDGHLQSVVDCCYPWS